MKSECQLPGTDVTVPYDMVADDAFPLKSYILKPYGQRGFTKEQCIFNYRPSRARRIVENGFGILANRFRVFMKPIALEPIVMREKSSCLLCMALTLAWCKLCEEGCFCGMGI